MRREEGVARCHLRPHHRHGKAQIREQKAILAVILVFLSSCLLVLLLVLAAFGFLCVPH